MAWLTPTFIAPRLTDVPLHLLTNRGIRALILDVDNTLAHHGQRSLAEGVGEWVGAARAAGLKLMILSNNKGARVAPVAEALGVPFQSWGLKPLPFRVWRCIRRMGATRAQTALIGDQVFTDVLGGNAAGITTVLVAPFELENGPFFRLKRWMEQKIIWNSQNNHQRM